MYRAAIADDEISIREGLQELVNWEELGFSLEAAFDTGEGLLAFLKQSPPDLIVTDIRMGHLSGLDISRYIQEHGLATRVILISGYKEADLAMSAIKYGVKDYILKPVDLDELTACIEKIKAELDAAALVLNRQRKLYQTQSDMRDILKLFFDELLSGRLSDKQLVRQMFELIYPAFSYEQSACFFCSLRIHQYDSFIQSGSHDSISSLPRYIDGFASQPPGNIHIRTVSRAQNVLTVFGILSEPVQDGSREIILHNMSKLCEEIRVSFRLRSKIENLRIFQNMEEMLKSASPTVPYADSLTGISEVSELTERTRAYIMEHIGEDISLDDVAARFYLSPSYFSRIFKAQTGETFVRFMSRCKMEYAAELLAATDLKIYDVCEKTGYRSLRHFNKLFKAYTGVQPSVYRQRMHMGEFHHEN